MHFVREDVAQVAPDELAAGARRFGALALAAVFPGKGDGVAFEAPMRAASPMAVRQT